MRLLNYIYGIKELTINKKKRNLLNYICIEVECLRTITSLGRHLCSQVQVSRLTSAVGS